MSWRARVRRAAARLLRRLHDLAESGWGGLAAFAWGFGQSSVVPGPSEALLIPLALADPRAAWRLAAWTLAGTVLGGFVAYAIGALAFDAVGQPMLALVGIGRDELEGMRALAERRGPLLVFVSAVTPVSTKVVSIAAGAFGLPFGEFALALVLARGARLFVVAALLRFTGERLRAYLERRGFFERREGSPARADGGDAAVERRVAPDAAPRVEPRVEPLGEGRIEPVVGRDDAAARGDEAGFGR